jgi:beta-lactam-binding protein with PASTA domain
VARWIVLTSLLALLAGLGIGFLWWGRPLQRTAAELATLQAERAAAEAARDRLKSVEAELNAERERRRSLERALSEGRK